MLETWGCEASLKAHLQFVASNNCRKLYDIYIYRVFLKRFRDPMRVLRISNRVPRITENYHRAPKIIKNRVPRIREIGSLQFQTGLLTFSLKKPLIYVYIFFQDIEKLCLKPLRQNITSLARDSQPGPGGPPVVHLEFRVVHRKFHKSLILFHLKTKIEHVLE